MTVRHTGQEVKPFWVLQTGLEIILFHRRRFILYCARILVNAESPSLMDDIVVLLQSFHIAASPQNVQQILTVTITSLPIIGLSIENQRFNLFLICRSSNFNFFSFTKRPCPSPTLRAYRRRTSGR